MNYPQTPSADVSLDILTEHIGKMEPFAFFRFGDGALECIYGGGKGKTCDGEMYTEALSRDLLQASACMEAYAAKRANQGLNLPPVYWGDWMTASFTSGIPTHVKKWDAFTAREFMPATLHFETLLLMRRSDRLRRFYSLAGQDHRRKLYIGPDAGAGLFLGCQTSALIERDGKPRTLALMEAIDSYHPDVIYFAAGMAGLVAAAWYWADHPYTTVVHLGSALDPLFHVGGKTRTGQLSRNDASKVICGIR